MLNAFPVRLMLTVLFMPLRMVFYIGNLMPKLAAIALPIVVWLVIAFAVYEGAAYLYEKVTRSISSNLFWNWAIIGGILILAVYGSRKNSSRVSKK